MAGRSRGRVIAPELGNTPRLQPGPIAPSTYVRPPQAQGGEKARALAEALSSLSGSLTPYANGSLTDHDKVKEDSDAYIGHLAGKSNDEILGLIKGGQVPAAYEHATYLNYGSRRVQDFKTEAPDMLAKLDPTKDDPMTALRGLAQKYVDAMPDGLSVGAFSKGIETYMNGAANDFTTARVTAVQTQRDNDILDSQRTIIQDAKDRGLDPAATAEAIVRNQQAQATVLHLPNETNNTILKGIITEQAEAGNVDLVNALLDNDRGGIGSLAKIGANIEFAAAAREHARQQKVKIALGNPDNIEPIVAYRQKADAGALTPKDRTEAEAKGVFFTNEQWTQLYDTSATKKAENERKAALLKAQGDAHTKAMMDADRAYQTGNMDSISGYTTYNADGSEKFVSADDQRKEHRDLRIQAIRDAKLPPERETSALLDLAEKGREEIPAWTSLFEMGGAAATPQALSQKPVAGRPGGPLVEGPLPPDLDKGFRLYKDLYRANPTVLDRHIKSDAERDFWETARVLTDNGLADREALMEARRITSTTSNHDLTFSYPEMDSIEKQVRIHYRSSFFDMFHDDVTNAGPIMLHVKELASVYRRAGMPQEQAIQTALDRIDRNFTMVNGWLVRTNERKTPTDFKPLIEAKLQDYFNSHQEKEDIGSLSDLVITSTGNEVGQYIIWNKKTGAPVEDYTQGHISFRDFPAMRAGKTSAVIRDTLRDNAVKSRNEAEAVRIGDEQKKQTLNPPVIETDQNPDFMSPPGAKLPPQKDYPAAAPTKPAQAPAKSTPSAINSPGKMTLEQYRAAWAKRRGSPVPDDVWKLWLDSGGADTLK